MQVDSNSRFYSIQVDYIIILGLGHVHKKIVVLLKPLVKISQNKFYEIKKCRALICQIQ